MSERSVDVTSSEKRCDAPSRLAIPGSNETAPGPFATTVGAHSSSTLNPNCAFLPWLNEARSSPIATPHLWLAASVSPSSSCGSCWCVPASALKPIATACGSVPWSARIVGETPYVSARPLDFPASMSNTPMHSVATATLFPLSPCVLTSVGETSSSAPSPCAFAELPGRKATTAVPP